MRDRKRRGLLRKRKRKFPDQNDRGIHENRKRSVLELTREISADPGVRTEQRPVSLGPTPRHIGEDRQDRELVIVVPKQKRIVPEKEETEGGDDESGADRTNDITFCDW